MARRQALELMADRLDDEAECDNFHDFVGTHRLLAALLHRELGREAATKIFRKIARMHGLQGMVGLSGKSAFEALKIPDCWKEWSLPD
jgi:hypothetical protein